MGRTNIYLDDNLVSRGLEVTGLRTKKDLVAADIYQGLQRKGMRIRGIVDCLIAATAIETGPSFFTKIGISVTFPGTTQLFAKLNQPKFRSRIMATELNGSAATPCGLTCGTCQCNRVNPQIVSLKPFNSFIHSRLRNLGSREPGGSKT